MKNKKPALIAPIRSLNELYNKARTDEKYKQLLLISSSNLGGTAQDINGAFNWLQTNAMETDEQGVIEEVNFCRDLVK